MSIDLQYMIELGYAESIKAASEIETAGRQIVNLSRNDMAEALCYLEQNWSGQNARDCLTKGYLLSDKIADSGQGIVKTGNVIRTIAGIVHDAEQRALNIIKR